MLVQSITLTSSHRTLSLVRDVKSTHRAKCRETNVGGVSFEFLYHSSCLSCSYENDTHPTTDFFINCCCDANYSTYQFCAWDMMQPPSLTNMPLPKTTKTIKYSTLRKKFCPELYAREESAFATLSCAHLTHLCRTSRGGGTCCSNGRARSGVRGTCLSNILLQ